MRWGIPVKKRSAKIAFFIVETFRLNSILARRPGRERLTRKPGWSGAGRFYVKPVNAG